MQLGRESWRSYTRRPRRAFGKRHGQEPNPACISEAALHRRGVCRVEREKEELLYLWMLPACLPACLHDASLGSVERAALKNWPVRWQSRYYGNVNLIRKTERGRDVGNPRSRRKPVNTSGLSQCKKQSPYTGWCRPVKQPIFVCVCLADFTFPLEHDLTPIPVFRDMSLEPPTGLCRSDL